MSKLQQRNDRSFNGKPILVVLFKKGCAYAYPLSMSAYRQSYFDFFKLAERYFSIFVVRGAHQYCGEGTFTRGYLYTHGRLHQWRRNIRARIIFDKDVDRDLQRQGEKGWIVVNNPQLARILKYKDRTYALFRKFMKTMRRVENGRELDRLLRSMHGTMVVFKPVDRYGGEGVVIAPKHAIRYRLRSFNGVVSEFIDTSRGIPGIAHSYHDLRVVLMDGRIVESYVRIPKRGSLISNYARGGSIRYISLQKVPHCVREIARKIDWRLRGFGHRIYSIDFGFEQGKPYVIELNERPGLPFRTDDRVNYIRWHKSLLMLLRKAAKN